MGVGALNHAQARAAVVQAFTTVMGRAPSLCEAQFAQAVALHESGYGSWWTGACAGSFNMGAIQSNKPPCGPGTCLYTDSYPNKDGTSTTYEVCFRTYPTPAAGFADLIKVMYMGKRASVLAAAGHCDIQAFSTAMYDTGYYGGFGATREIRIKGHVTAITKRLKEITTALKEPMPVPGAGVSVAKAGGIGFLTLVGIGLAAYAGIQLARHKPIVPRDA